ncbi:unnamed protein product [Bemisia tabaci]|uniref:Uncharacterized protein n=1 Tax=Bemisia tabaci TaxID=7038 RepID=A0A9P0F7G5_BEMTA|nr:unnamed protein product [Bemisia tabaci]
MSDTPNCIQSLMIRYVDCETEVEACSKCSACLKPENFPMLKLYPVMWILLPRLQFMDDPAKGCLLCIAKLLCGRECKLVEGNKLHHYKEVGIFAFYSIQDVLYNLCVHIASGLLVVKNMMISTENRTEDATNSKEAADEAPTSKPVDPNSKRNILREKFSRTGKET